MSRRGWLWWGMVLGGAAVLAACTITGQQLGEQDWVAFVVLCTLAAFAQMYRVEVFPNYSVYFVTTAFFVAAMFMLSPALFVLFAIIPHLIEWVVMQLTEGRDGHLGPWYIQPFNIALEVIAGLTTRGIYVAINQNDILGSSVPDLVARLIAALSYPLITQMLLGQALVLARNLTWREHRLLTLDNLLPEFMLACLGVTIATVWKISAWLIVPALAPLVLIYQALHIPKLREERERTLQVFGQHVSPAVVDTLLHHPINPAGELRMVCLMFLDIRDFTKYAEQRTPQEVMSFLNSLFEPMVDSVNGHGGIINKFLGDGFLAMFGAPIEDKQASSHAVAAAREILAKLDDDPLFGGLSVKVGIGLHAGEAVTGTVGSAQRKEYTLIGDVVNLASRIEQLNKQFGSQLLISEMVWDVLSLDERSGGIELGPVSVKGRERPVHVYQLA